jgi:hypothetical protein
LRSGVFFKGRSGTSGVIAGYPSKVRGALASARRIRFCVAPTLNQVRRVRERADREALPKLIIIETCAEILCGLDCGVQD